MGVDHDLFEVAGKDRAKRVRRISKAAAAVGRGEIVDRGASDFSGQEVNVNRLDTRVAIRSGVKTKIGLFSRSKGVLDSQFPASALRWTSRKLRPSDNEMTRFRIRFRV